MISTPDRHKAIELIDEARAAGARLRPACKTLGIPCVSTSLPTAPDRFYL